MSARDDLLDALLAERYNGGGWKTPPKEWTAVGSTSAPIGGADDEVTTARRRRELVESWGHDADEEAG